MSEVAENIKDVRRRIAEAAGRVDRDPSSVTLVAVTKTVSPQKALEAVEAGVTDLGEARTQEAKRKYEVIGNRAVWHLIGPLQTNKAKYCPGLFSLIHSLDRMELISELSRRAELAGTVVDGLLQVNISGEKQKSGCRPQDAGDILKSASSMRGVRITGLMTIPPACDDPEDSRPVFRSLMELKSDLTKIGIENVSLSIVSAGMTNDYEVAVEEGSTLVRVGTAIFGSRS
ncbi:MAG: YggS family pyridoxal phosphate-dependent enzyme [Nitrospinae bacterium]|nr:YggS family pyridoxal phosphate-dependent enzyme [Nitrospinota bacterium]MBF0634128.1 YggS family pyridoxal phosphate-dependent enzyme [Nitrospinota bacterium]